MANSFTELQKEQEKSNQISLRAIITGIKNDSREQLWADDSAWVQYVKDHYTEIKEKCVDTIIDPNDAAKHAYSLESVLAKNSVPRSVAWIVAWLNHMDSDLHFGPNTDHVLLPDTNQLLELRKQYITTRVMYRKALDTTSL